MYVCVRVYVCWSKAVTLFFLFRWKQGRTMPLDRSSPRKWMGHGLVCFSGLVFAGLFVRCFRNRLRLTILGVSSLGFYVRVRAT